MEAGRCMSVRTRRSKSLIAGSHPTLPGPQYHRKRHVRRENRLRLAALRQLSAQQVRERAALAIAPRADANQTIAWLIRATTILLSAATCMLIVGVARALTNSGESTSYQLGLAVVATALILLGLSSTRSQWKSPTAAGKPRWKLLDQLQMHVGTSGSINENQLRSVFSICAFGGGLSLALLPLVLRLSMMTDQWLESAFVWYSLTETIRLLFLNLFVLAAPLTFVWFGLRLARLAIRQFDGEVTSMPLLVLLGGMLGFAGAECVRNAVSSPATLLIAAAIPCFVVPILWLRRTDNAEPTGLLDSQ